MMTITNKQRMKMVAPLMAALLLSACGDKGDEGLPSQTTLAGDSQMCEVSPGFSIACDDDNDGQSNADELAAGTDPNNPNDPVQGGNEDHDGDGLKKGLEVAMGWDDNDPDNPVKDGNKDEDGDGIKKGREEIEGWDDNDANNPIPNGHEDSDDDHIKKGLEAIQGWDDTDSNVPVNGGNQDSDGDKLNDGLEEINSQDKVEPEWDKNDPDKPVPGGASNDDSDNFSKAEEVINGWDDNDPNNPISSENVQSVELVLSNSVVKPGLGLQASIDYQAQGYSDTFTTLDVPDADHVSWGIVNANGDSVVGLTPTSEGHLTIPESAEVMDYVDEPLTMQATFTEEGWFKHQTPQEKTFTVTLAEVSSSEVALLKDGVPLEGSEINIGDSIQAQTTVTLADGSEILAPSDASTGTWSIDQAAKDLGVTIDPVTGELDTSGVDNAAVGEDGVSISLSWTGAGSLEGGEGSMTVRLEGYPFAVTKISDTLTIGPLVTVSMAESLESDYIEPPVPNGIAYFERGEAEEYCGKSGGVTLGDVMLSELATWLGDPSNDIVDYKAGVGYMMSGEYANADRYWYIGGGGSDPDYRGYVYGGLASASVYAGPGGYNDNAFALVCAYE
ncbi:hypothetical protein [Vibrio genomosp. F10]|uniref:hypothetical protein n=1 Tax=Vibrio genomosp. F10 TaxID=723171 RepID=UPI0003033133|nr:hypothetical protein [Vibrio genomosp. F10]OEF07797.1 hypothetical protein A1QI_16660 [Vibrio genomosp. F10 str. 9ZB36]